LFVQEDEMSFIPPFLIENPVLGLVLMKIVCTSLNLRAYRSQCEASTIH
jgi:hypothetical protein